MSRVWRSHQINQPLPPARRRSSSPALPSSGTERHDGSDTDHCSIVLVVLIILLFVGFKWAKPQILRLKVWNWLESEMRSPDEPEPPKRAIKPLVMLVAC